LPKASEETAVKSAEVARGLYRFRNELSPVLTIVVLAANEDKAREELARIGLHPSFFDLVGE